MFVKRLPLNETGRDFVVGDIHGCFGLVEAGLERVGFDTAKDRLISVGDLINRGPRSNTCLSFLKESWFFAVRGNHEEMYLRLFNEDTNAFEGIDTFDHSIGMGWAEEFSSNQHEQNRILVNDLPVAIEVDTPKGPVGVVHAEVPLGLKWPNITWLFNEGDHDVIKQALWSRGRIERQDVFPVSEVFRVFHGHTPQRGGIRAFANRFYIDTGSYKNYVDGLNGYGLSIVNAVASDEDMLKARFIDGVLTVDCQPS